MWGANPHLPLAAGFFLVHGLAATPQKIFQKTKRRFQNFPKNKKGESDDFDKSVPDSDQHNDLHYFRGCVQRCRQRRQSSSGVHNHFAVGQHDSSRIRMWGIGMALTNLQLADAFAKRDLHVYGNLSALMDACIALKEEPDDVKAAVDYAKVIKNISSTESRTDVRFADLYWKALLLLAPYDFDSYLIYMEREREPKERFYLPRRDVLRKHGLIDGLQSLEEGKYKLMTISMPPGTAKTTLEEFFASWIIGRDPSGYSLFASHSADITRLFYDSVNSITSSSEYKFADVFPECKKQSENAKAETINFGKYKPFKSLQCTSVGSKNAGKVRCNKYLLCDDLIGNQEEAISKPRMDKLWMTYSVDLRQRKKDRCKELHVSTIWTVHDVVSRLKRDHSDDPQALFIVVPDVDPETNESNFEYKYGVGFSREYFQDMEDTMDEVSYKCLYKGEPIEREGLLYPEDSLRRYVALPAKDPDAIIGVCDTKSKGKDYMFLPCFYQYGNDYYMHDCICSDESDFEIQYSRIADIIIRNKMQMVDFESNSGGDRVAAEVEKRIQGKQSCGITMHYTTQNKETKIIVNAEWVKKHCLFKDRSLYSVKSDYGKAMSFIMSYTVAGKNAFDDTVDGLAQFAQFTSNLLGSKTEIFESPF